MVLYLVVMCARSFVVVNVFSWIFRGAGQESALLSGTGIRFGVRWP